MRASTDPAVGTNASQLVQGTVCQDLGREHQAHKGATTWKTATPSSSRRMAEVLCVYREVQVLKKLLPTEEIQQAGSDRLLR